MDNHSVRPMTQTLTDFANRHGIEVNLTPLAIREQAFNDMMRAALARDDAAWDAAKARYEGAMA